MDIRAERNAFGRQLHSFEADLDIAGLPGGPLRAIFIRAPWIAEHGAGVEVLATLEGHPVAARQGSRAGGQLPRRAGHRRPPAPAVPGARGAALRATAAGATTAAEADDAVALLFDRAAVSQQQVDVAQDLRERQVGLGDRHVAPQLVGDLVGGAGLLGDQPVDLLGTAVVHPEAFVDQGHVVADRPPVAGQHEIQLHRPCLFQRVHVGHQRLRAGPRGRARPPTVAPAGGWRRCGRSGGRRASMIERRSSWKTVSEGLWPGRWRTRSVRSPSTSSEPSASGLVTSTAEPQARKPADTARRAVTTSWGMPWRSIDPLGEGVVEVGLPPVGREVAGEGLERGHLGSRAPGQDRGQPEVVHVLVADDQQLDVLDRVAAGVELLLELVQGLGRVRPGVDQGQRRVLDQVGVDRARP